MSMYLFNAAPVPLVTEGYKYLIAKSVINPVHFPVNTDLMRHMPYSDTTWDYDRFDFSAIVEAENVLSGQLEVRETFPPAETTMTVHLT